MKRPALKLRDFRKNFAKITKVINIPNLIEIQKRSFDNFLQPDIAAEERKNIGLQTVFNSVFPIRDFNNTASLEFVNYTLDHPKYDVEECRQRGMTFAAPFKVLVRLIVFDVDAETGVRTIRDAKEQDVYFGEFPLMTENGTFIINGTERVIVSQLHRSPGVFFDHDRGKSHSSGKLLYSARVIPYRGSWLDFEFDHRDILHVRIDRRRKMPATVLLRALGFDPEYLLNYFYQSETVFLEEGKIFKSITPELLLGQKISRDIKSPKNEILVKKNRKVTKLSLKKIKEAGLERIQIDLEDIVGHILARGIVNPDTGEVLAEHNQPVTEALLESCRELDIPEFSVLFMDSLTVGSSLRDTLLLDKVNTTDEGILEIYQRLRPGDPPTLDTAKNFFENLFFNPERYDLSRVGRLKMNYKLQLDAPLDVQTLQTDDILRAVKYLIGLKNGKGMIDDIDHLGNRRVRTVGELLENQYRIGLVRMERAIKERMSLAEIETMMPHDLINAKPVSAVVKEFFGSSQLSQFMDQTNPLSEITHKRRLSALGPGGLTRERAGFEVRDVHSTHYGRICPIETPEGPNIGLIASLSTYARINEHGFIETPYRTVANSKVGQEVVYLSALQEENSVIAQANAPLDKKGNFINEWVNARKSGEPMLARNEDITHMDVSPNQLVSVAASLIPFLEHDDANRALMGANMQRQAVPLLRTNSPLIGTGVEGVVAQDSGVALVARRAGTIESVDATRIVIRVDDKEEPDSGSGVDIYNLVKYQRSNQNTCINQRPIINCGEYVDKGSVIADGPATDHGELALGANIMVAFMPWGGYNFEDSILISERLVVDDVFTSIHIEEFECVARDTKLGMEEITRDIPNVGEDALRYLDESGIIAVGAEVHPSSILVGKITPKGETQLSPEEKLLRAIFGDKAGDVRDSSLRVPPGVTGIVIDAKVFSRKGIEKDERSQYIEDAAVHKHEKDRDDQTRIVKENSFLKVRELLLNRKVQEKLIDNSGKKVFFKKGDTITKELIDAVPRAYWKGISAGANPEETSERMKAIVEGMNKQVEMIKMLYDQKIDRLRKGDELPPGVIKMVKVFVAIKRKISVGDKMAGRHGNKGVLSRILPVEDMPYLDDGTAVDLVLNPLGVPSRMNVGQILETHLGWAAAGMGAKISEIVENNLGTDAIRKQIKSLFTVPELQEQVDAAKDFEIEKMAKRMSSGIRIATPVFDGATEEEIKGLLSQADLPTSGQTWLFDGRTGERFHAQVTVGIMYMLKLHHLVDDKIHARSTGPYSLVTQQPLGGKAQFGGQRLGEMEVWAMEAYGAAYGLQEFLTVKSDDVGGRTRMYEAIVKGKNSFDPGMPESFNVLIKELQSLALNVELLEDEDDYLV
jgi:DNA-directed RNA polymerase subunit beta